jgi:y4mF family transcriptional regulator
MGAEDAEIGNILPLWREAMEDALAIAARIRAARKDAGLTQEDLAHLAGTSERTVRALETGTGNPSLRAVVSVANVLGLRVAVG